MLIRFALRRVRRTPRLMGMLLLSIALVSAFVALAPIYVREVTKSAFEVRLRNLDVEQFKVELENDEPLDDATAAQIQTAFDERLQTIKISAISGQMYPRYPAGSPPPDLQMRPTTFQDFDNLFTVVEGRMPQSTPGDDNVEVVMTAEAWEKLLSLSASYADYTLGTVFEFGEENTGTAQVTVVGLVESSEPALSPYWEYREFTFGDLSAHEMRQEFMLYYGVITTEAIFNEEIAPLLPQTAYFWEVQLDPAMVSVDDLSALSNSIDSLESTLRDQYPTIVLRSPLIALVDDFNQTIRETEQPIILLAVLVATLMFYNLITIMTLIFEQQRTEWAIIVSRGGGKAQLMTLHLLTILPLGVIAAILGPIFAQLGMIVLAQIGPQAAILTSPALSDIPASAFILSTVISIIALLILTIPAYPLSNTRLLDLKRRSSRPPVAPIWQRFFLDFILLAVGIGFFARQINLASGGTLSLPDVLTSPDAFLTLLSSESLSDPFNLAAPVLILTGAALLWMRIFPFIMQGLSAIFNRLQSLATQMALWNVERNPNHYAQIVLLIVGTLAIGTASLSLNQTRDDGAWATASQAVGGDASVTLDASADNLPDWETLPGVSSSTRLLQYSWDGAIPDTLVSLIGVDIADFAEENPALDSLLQADPVVYSGTEISEDSVAMGVDFSYENNALSENEDSAQAQSEPVLLFRDAVGLEFEVSMTAQSTPEEAVFTNYTADLSELTYPRPFRFEGLAFRNIGDTDTVEQTIFVDNLTVTDAEGQTSILDDFESSTWEASVASTRSQVILAVGTTTAQSTDGSNRLRVLTRQSSFRPNNPTVLYNPQPVQPIPVLVSPAFADIYGSRARLGRDMRVDDVIRSEIIAFNTLGNLNRAEVYYTVRGIVEEFPGVAADTPYIVAERDTLRYQINGDRNRYGYFDFNTVRLTLDDREPTQSLITQLNAIPGVTDVRFAWEQFQEIQREPLPNAITGMLFAGFWVSLVLILIDFAFYMAVTTERRLSGFAVLLSMGWERRRIWQMLTVEQAAFITPALIVGVLLGLLIAYLILPFMALIGQSALSIPGISVGMMLVALVACFSLIVVRTANRLMHIDISSVWRTVE